MSKDVMRYFTYEHLPPALAEVSKPICDVAISLNESLPDNEQKGIMLQKLLEAKDCAVRSFISEAK